MRNTRDRLPTRLIDPLWKAHNYVGLRAGMGDLVREQRKRREIERQPRVRVREAESRDWVKLDAGTLSGVASHSLPAGTFTSAYDTYLVVIKLSAQGTGTLFVRSRVGGTDAAAVNSYAYESDWVNLTPATGVIGVTNTGMVMLAEAATARAEQTWYLWITDPATAVFTQYSFAGQVRFTGAATYWRVNGGGTHVVATAYDSLTLLTSAGLMTGTIKTYALAN
jgi:hypothetical protein